MRWQPEPGAPDIHFVKVHRAFDGDGGAPVVALRGLDLMVGSGATTALVGPNGAGKTTAFRIASTLLSPTTGECLVRGLSTTQQAGGVRRLIGVSFGGELGFYDRLTARGNLAYFASLQMVPRAVRRKRVGQLLDEFGLTEAADRRVAGFSRGMKQRLHLARALLHDPPIVLLDEPTSGLDPENAAIVRSAVDGMREQGKTILLSTHTLSEAERLADTIHIIDAGRLVFGGSAEMLRQASGSAEWVVEVKSASEHPCDWSLLGKVISVRTESANGYHAISVFGRGPRPGEAALSDVRTESISRLWVRTAELEDAYLSFLRDRSSMGEVPA